jgi:hypothetical protein
VIPGGVLAGYVICKCGIKTAGDKINQTLKKTVKAAVKEIYP